MNSILDLCGDGLMEVYRSWVLVLCAAWFVALVIAIRDDRPARHWYDYFAPLQLGGMVIWFSVLLVVGWQFLPHN